MPSPLQQPPDWRRQLLKPSKEVLEALGGPVGEAIRRLGDDRRRYLHWEGFRRHEMPGGLAPTQAWAVLKFQRAGAARMLPLQGARGKPLQLVLSDPLRAALRRIDVHQALRDAGVPESDGPDSATFWRRALLEEALASSRIEGARTTRAVGRELLRSGREPRDRSERMVLNNYRALEQLDEWTTRPLSPDLLCDIQAVVTDGTLDHPDDAGRIRKDDEVRVMDAGSGDVVHHPPPWKELPERLEHLCSFANAPDDDEDFLHPVVRAILLHYQLAFDHPFGDGNGRTARWLFLWSMVRRREYRWFRFLHIARRIERRRHSYYRAFQHVATDEFDVTYFVRHQVGCIEQESLRFARFLQRRREQEETVRRRFRLQDHLNARQVALYDHFLRHRDAVYTQRGHAAYHGVSLPSAGRDLNDLVAKGLLARERLAQGFVYRPTARLRALAER